MAENKQDLIKWMTETRENLTFDSKVKLIKDFWDNKEGYENLLKKYKKNNLTEVEILIENKFKENKQLATELDSKNNEINTILTKLFRK